MVGVCGLVSNRAACFFLDQIQRLGKAEYEQHPVLFLARVALSYREAVPLSPWLEIS